MIPIKTYLVEKGSPRQLAARWERTIFKEALKGTLVWWHDKLFPAHFESNAATKYRHRPRSAGWIKRKIAVTGQNVDNVFTGSLRDEMLATHYEPTGTAKRATLRIPGPNYLEQRKRELSAMTGQEGRELAQKTDQLVQDGLDRAVREIEPEKTRIG